MDQIIAALVGGFLAAGTGWFLQNRIEVSRLKRLKQLLIVGISDDLKSSIELYDRVIDEWEKSQIVWFTTLNELRESRQTYLKNRDWMVLINDEVLRQKLFKYYHRSADHINLLENQQRRKYDIQSKLNDVIRDLKIRNDQLTQEQALEQAVRLMHAEDQELFGINNFIPSGIQRMRDFKGEAKELLDAFSKGTDV
ncbi:MAG: hypothetical protein KKC76_10395 [Proteobacteria bacterium]|nr:hypothetical protein [Pseudomonadota bacterium]MBU4295406.1 hypothetical protein [Pseudomonadota bacterium]MCG2748924.1 hypothetical protein [Desulfobulbaceae bacterium]